jgi:hypothetical protein
MNTKRVTLIVACALVGVMVTDHAMAATYRYRLSGDWQTVTDGVGPGWGVNPNNDGSPGIGLPGSADDARINWGNNTVTVTTAVPTVNRVQIGVDESGIVQVNSGGILTTGQDLLAGNNNANATGTLIVNDGGVVNVGRILWAANNNSSGVITINNGGTVNVASHLWLGVTGTASIGIYGSLFQTGGMLGLGTSNASTPSGGAATVTIGDGGLLALNNISSAAGLPSVQPGSFINITGSGEMTLPGSFVGVLTDYANANKIGGLGVPGMSNLAIDTIKNPGFTTAYVVPEPSTFGLLAFAGLALAARRLGRKE